jgi:hypothetical protein
MVGGDYIDTPSDLGPSKNQFNDSKQKLTVKKDNLGSIDGSAGKNLNLTGGKGSAWRMSAYSRGPVNYPNNSWFNGKQQFRQFTKDGQYIKNTDLPYAVAPISTGVINNNSPVTGTISKWGDSFAKYGGNKKKIKKKSTKKKSTKKKSTKKKSTKKKSTKKKSTKKK